MEACIMSRMVDDAALKYLRKVQRHSKLSL
jgi:hypothetical protein